MDSKAAIATAAAAVLTAVMLIVGASIGPPGGPPPEPSDAGPVIAALAPPAGDEEPPAADPARPGQPYTQTIEVGRGDTLVAMLLEAGVGRDEAHAAIGALRRIYDPRRLRPGQEITLTLRSGDADDRAERLIDLALPVDHVRLVRVERSEAEGFSATEIERALTRRLVRAQGTIRSNLYADATRAGVPVSVLVEMIRAFSWDVDFQRDIQPGDRFEVLFERFADRQGRTVHEGAIRVARLTLSGVRQAIYRHATADGETDYYNENGESVRKALLRTPIDGAKLSSAFGVRRHPVLGFSKMHRGVDFAAPAGTPIFAAGTGVVDRSGWNGDYGHYVRIRHTAAYATAYAHLSAYAKGIRKGSRVRQGQVIGFVGSTGLSTGPNLHYEVLKENAQINPMSVKMPSGRRLAGFELEGFRTAKAEIDRQETASIAEARLGDEDL